MIKTAGDSQLSEMDSFLLFTSLQAAWESFSIPEIVALPFLS